MSSDSSSAYTSNSKDGIVLKAVIDYSYYLTLLKAEKELKQRPVNKAVEVPKTSASVEQLGEGSSSKKLKFEESKCISETELRKILREELKSFFPRHSGTFGDALKKTTLGDVAKKVAPLVKKFVGFGNEPEEQEGAGYVDNDLNPSIIKEQEIPQEEGGGGFVQELNHLEPLVNVNDFLKLIPNKWHKNAAKLLKIFEEKPMLISWNTSTGEVIVNGETIPDSNIYSVFKELYNEHPDHNVSGYVTVASALLELGLGYLFHKSHLSYFSRKRNFKEPEQAGEGLPFYFIGD